MGYFNDDVIAQIATPPGPGLIGVIRVSGDHGFSITDRLLADRPSGQPARTRQCLTAEIRLATARSVTEKAGDTITVPALIWYMPGPASYTREDVAEIHVSGSPALLRLILDELCRHGAREAMAGEFTFRAFRNGRLSLAQAEAVERLIQSSTINQKQAALGRLGDRSISRIKGWRDTALSAAAMMEAAIDFGDDTPEDAIGESIARLLGDLETNGVSLDAAAAPLEHELPTVGLTGLANAGKSSLFNRLLHYNASLVSPVPSTTRDRLDAVLTLNGERVILSDNPGYHPVETGMDSEVSRQAMARLPETDVVCWVIDASVPLDHTAIAFVEHLPVQRRIIVVLNKNDLAAKVVPEEVRRLLARHGICPVAGVSISARGGEGFDALREAIVQAVAGLTFSSSWNHREYRELQQAMGHCRRAAVEMKNHGRLELAADDMRHAIESFSRGLGEGYAEEALTRIFSTFCLGK